MSSPTNLLPFQPAAMSTAQLAAMSFLARYSERTYVLYAYRLPAHHHVTADLLAALPPQGYVCVFAMVLAAPRGTGRTSGSHPN